GDFVNRLAGVSHEARISASSAWVAVSPSSPGSLPPLGWPSRVRRQRSSRSAGETGGTKSDVKRAASRRTRETSGVAPLSQLMGDCRDVPDALLMVVQLMP